MTQYRIFLRLLWRSDGLVAGSVAGSAFRGEALRESSRALWGHLIVKKNLELLPKELLT